MPARRIRIFKTKVFARFARKAGIDDTALREAVARAQRGLIDADFGGGVIKQRVARPGGGRSGGFRVVVLYAVGERAVFVYGFGKNERDNVRDDELIEFRRLASLVLAYRDDELITAIGSGALVEVADG
jgi:hypothetical protein